MYVEVDISGNIKFLYKDSVMAFATKEGKIYNTVFLDKRLKREIFTKHKSKIRDVKEQMHCIMIYYCIKNYVNKISEIRICPDISPDKLHHYLELVFSDNNSFLRIKKRIKPVKHNSFVHKIAYRTYKRKIKPNLTLTKEMMLKLLLKE